MWWSYYNECYNEIEELIYNGQLYTKDIYENIAKKFEEEPNYIFGGEPLLNIGVVKKIDYARSLEKQYNKNFRFTITTNATLLTEKVMDYLEENMLNIVLSIDGRKKGARQYKIKN